MDKDNYNIDDIISEVKKRREENEKIVTEEKTPETAESVKEETPVEEPAAEEEVSVEEEATVEEETPAEEEVSAKEEAPVEEEKMVDLLTLSEAAVEEEEKEEDNEEENNDNKKEKSAKKKSIKIAVSIVAVLLVVVIVAGIIFGNNLINVLVDNGKETVATTEKPWEGMDTLKEDFTPIDETEATQLSSLQDMIKTWYYNGDPCYSSHVLNVLLIGEDTRGSDILEEGTRADSAIIVSVNIDTKTITLTSILRDAWAYWETEKGNTSSGQFGKINGAMSTGDINAYMNCLERLYKIDIDNYAIVNFDSFEGIVDALGGVTLELTEKEINEINNHPKRYGKVTIEKTFEGTKGKIKLNGKQALAYCRIRKIDSDNMRADRQKTTLIEIFEETKDASLTKLIKVVEKLVPYVKTSFGKSEILKIARYAITQGWLDYDINMQNLPDYRLAGGTESAFGQWIWRPDYPADSYNLQMTVYGKSNITLAHLRVDTKTCPATGFYSEGYGATSATITNNNYGEVTTVTTTKKKESSN